MQYANKNIPENERYNGIGDCFKRVVKEQGYVALWRGNLANVIRYFPTQALNFACKDFYKQWLCPYNPKKEPGLFFLGNMASGGAAGALLSQLYILLILQEQDWLLMLVKEPTKKENLMDLLIVLRKLLKMMVYKVSIRDSVFQS